MVSVFKCQAWWSHLGLLRVNDGFVDEHATLKLVQTTKGSIYCSDKDLNQMCGLKICFKDMSMSVFQSFQWDLKINHTGRIQEKKCIFIIEGQMFKWRGSSNSPSSVLAISKNKGQKNGSEHLNMAISSLTLYKPIVPKIQKALTASEMSFF